MNDFTIWFEIGLEHILDLSGYDHILYVVLLSMAYSLAEWKKLVILLTGFTVGHSISLALAVINKWTIQQAGIEILIALSIAITAIYQAIAMGRRMFTKKSPVSDPHNTNYFFYSSAVIFGMVHGLGFSFLLRAMLGSADNVFLPLLYFNLGLECGQLIIVGVILLFSLILRLFIKERLSLFKILLICSIAIISLVLCVQRVFQFLWS